MPAMTLVSERWLDQVLVFGTTTTDSAGADFSVLFTFPGTLGDVALLEMEVLVSPLATSVASLVNLGCNVAVVSPDGATQLDIVGHVPWYKLSATLLGCYLSPDPLVMIRRGEQLQVRAPELDIHAVPTAEVLVNVKVVRVRPVEGPAGPIQLVR